MFYFFKNVLLFQISWAWRVGHGSSFVPLYLKTFTPMVTPGSNADQNARGSRKEKILPEFLGFV